MCGIAGFWDKTHNDQAAVGQTIFKMMQALGCRGPDSAGVALFTHQHDGDLVVRVKLGETDDLTRRGKQIAERVQATGAILGEIATNAEYLRLVIDTPPDDPRKLERLIEAEASDVEVVSMGHNLEIVKQVGSPENLEATHGITQITGTHGIAHTRLSTESIVDLSHSQPFWAHGALDLATVHNGHITNYDKLRRQYEQRGVRFYTHNDSEIIGIYLAEKMAKGLTLEEAMRASLVDLDGSFSYLAATADALGFAKDPFALKPLLVTETDHFVAIATEEIAIRAAFADDGNGQPYQVREAQAKEVRGMAPIDCTGKSIREINLAIKAQMAQGNGEIVVQNPAARHNLGVALLQPGKVTFAGSVGYYCGGMSDGATIEIQGSAGWGLAESMLNGTVTVQSNAGNGAAASIRGGTVVVHGDAAARAGVAIKGGLLLIGGNCGYMAGFMGQKGTIIVCGDTGDAFADSMYETVCYVGGSIAELGNDAVVETPTAEERAFLASTFARYLPANAQPAVTNFKKVVAGRKLWNFDHREWKTWREAL